MNPCNMILSFVFWIVLATCLSAQEDEYPRRIEVDYDKIKVRNSHFETECVGAGRAAELLRKGAIDHLKDASENCGFKYLRFHGLFHDEMAVYNEGKAPFNFQYVDMVYDAIVDTGMKPFVELGFMPEALASGKQTVFWWKANVTPPKDYDKWAELIREFTQHVEQRYGREEVRKWYFEVWNEPNYPAFFSGKKDDYFKLYEVTSRAIKKVCPEYRVGGPASAGNAWVKELISYCNEQKLPLDFISTHTYGVKGILDESGKNQHYLIPGQDVIASSVKEVRRKISSSPMPDLQLHYTEWSTSSSSRDPVHDSYISAAYIVNALKRSEGQAQSMSYWTFTDIFEEAGPPRTPFHGGFGLINLQGLHKPSFYAFKFLHELGDEELICSDTNAKVCRGKTGLQALVWNYTPPANQDEPNKTYFKRDLKPKPLGEAELVVNGVPEGDYQLEVFGVGYRMNDVYADFMDMGSPSNLTREQVRTLAEKNKCSPLLQKRIKINSSKPFRHRLEMRENDLFLIVLKKEE